MKMSFMGSQIWIPSTKSVVLFQEVVELLEGGWSLLEEALPWGRALRPYNLASLSG